ncbi:MAG TPA: hypothetical protein VLJ16_13630 [Acidobacteriota bacterium]|nr:hypothetical protein [Acidobacteriota bacterium]
MRRRGIFLLVVLAAMAASPLLAGKVPDPGAKGPYEIGFAYFQLVDTSRNTDIGGRPIAVYLWYPADPAAITASTPEAVYPLDPYFGTWPDSVSSDWEAAGCDRAYQEAPVSAGRPFPLVVLSPGWGCGALYYSLVAARLASHGLMVAVLYHYGDGALAWEPWDHVGTAALNRPLDMSFALTALLGRSGTPSDFFSGAVDPDLIAASGHSIGGYAAMVLAGAKDDSVCDAFYAPDWLGWLGPPPAETCVPGLPDPRIKAAVLLDGSSQILKFEELSRLAVPALGLAEEWNSLLLGVELGWSAPGFETWQARQHAAFQGHPNYRVDISGTWHWTFSNILEVGRVYHDKGLLSDDEYAFWLEWNATAGLDSLEAQRLFAKYIIAFLKTHLAGEPGYQGVLTPGYALTREQSIELFVTEKRNPNAIAEDWPGDFIYFPHQPGSEQALAPKDPNNAPLIRHARIRR